MPDKRITGYETNDSCADDGGAMMAIADPDGNLKYNTPDYVDGVCTRCGQHSGVPRVRVDKDSPVYEEE